MRSVNFTTIPTRIHLLEPLLKSLKSQTIEIEDLNMWFPEKFKGMTTEIPDFFKNYNVNVYLIEDLGPITKIWYALKNSKNGDRVVTIDDDIHLPNDWNEKLLGLEKKYPNSALGFRGRNLLNNLKYESSRLFIKHKKRENVDIITGTWTASYKKDFFKEDFFHEDFRKFLTTDDIWINGHLAKNKIKRIIFPNPGIKPSRLCDIDSLYSRNQKGNGHNNNKAIKFFEKHWIN